MLMSKPGDYFAPNPLACVVAQELLRSLPPHSPVPRDTLGGSLCPLDVSKRIARASGFSSLKFHCDRSGAEVFIFYFYVINFYLK